VPGQYDVVIEVSHGRPDEEALVDIYRMSLRSMPSWKRSQYVAAALHDAAREVSTTDAGITGALSAVYLARSASMKGALPGSLSLVVEVLMDVAGALAVPWQPPLVEAAA
jgi:hypothetical protein